MDDYANISSQLRRELETLPRDYTKETATRNWDVLTNMIFNFNIGRFLIFMSNYQQGIPDRINITKFGVDGPATTAILYYDGNCIIYAIDDTRYSPDSFYFYYGYEITVKYRSLNQEEGIIDYNLIPSEGREMPILGIWVGLRHQIEIE